jgi:hypothetical protein
MAIIYGVHGTGNNTKAQKHVHNKINRERDIWEQSLVRMTLQTTHINASIIDIKHAGKKALKQEECIRPC